MFVVVMFYLVQIAIVIGLILLGVFVYDKRYKKDHDNQVPEGYRLTDEVSIDPTTGEKQRVYYNADTGERFYRKES